MIVFTLMVIVLMTAFLVHCYIHYFSRRGKLINQIPGLAIIPIVGNMFDYLCVPFEKWFIHARKINNTFYPIHKYWLFGISIVTITDPDDVEVVLSSTKYIDKCWGYTLLRPWLGTGLLISSGNKWHKRRKMITPTFHFNILRDFIDVFVKEAQNLVKTIKAKGPETIEHVNHLSEKYTLYTVCESAMGTSLHGLSGADEYLDSVKKVSEIIAYRVVRPWFLNNWIFSWSSKGIEQERLLKQFHGFSQNIIKQRKQYHEKLASQKSMNDENSIDANDDLTVPRKRMALLDLLIHAYREGGQIDDVGIQEEVDTFIFEGFDTTGAALCFSLLLLAEHKDIQEKARQEVDEILMNNNRKIGMKELQSLSFLERCIKESLRLYPSVHLISRALKEDIQLKNYLVPSNTSVHIHIYDVHRNPNFWPDPLKFDPDRFLPNRIQGRHPYSYIPFSAGPRNCIGQKFAMLELKTAIAYILHNFYMEPIEFADNVKIYTDLVLKLTPPVRIKFITREK